MDVRFENRDTFYVSGFSTETGGTTLEMDCATLKEKHEDKLKSLSDNLYFLTWSPNGYESEDLVCHLGVESTDLTLTIESATSVKLPAARYAVATVPKGVSIIAAWQEFYEKGIPSLNAEIDLNYGIHFEVLDANGVCGLWVPVD